MVILQPADRGTAAGIFLPLTYIVARDAEATVIVYPSDHFVYPEQRFLDSVRRAVLTADWLPDRLVLLGVTPDRLELNYGWILPGEQLDCSSNYRVQAVRAFSERPTPAEADAALAAGALWNASVFAANAQTLWDLGCRCFPDLMPLFERLHLAIGTPHEARVLDLIYHQMPSDNFSSGLLQRIPEQTAVIEMKEVLWSDWGRPERIADSLRRIGRQPAFPLACLDRPFAPTGLTASEGRAMAGL
ncbi:MAG: sugar phosphate nucleotidyltransferase [Nitrospirota bacterium]